MVEKLMKRILIQRNFYKMIAVLSGFVIFHPVYAAVDYWQMNMHRA